MVLQSGKDYDRSMNILIDIGHPGHVHLLKNVYRQLVEKGHRIIVTVKDIPVALNLLRHYGMEYINLGKKDDSLVQKAWNQISYNYKLIRLINKYNIDLGVGSSISLAQVSSLSRMKSIILDDDDDEVQPYFVRFAHPFADTLLSPDCLLNHRKKKSTLYYSGYHELAYLHPNHFTPDPNVLSELGLTRESPFFVIRFNVFKAHHDAGIKGISHEQKMQLINLLKPQGKIFITTERDIDPELREYQFPISPEKMHSVLYYAKMFIGDSQTMTSEAAVLGTPSIRCNSFANRISYLREQEYRYGLTYAYTPENFGGMLEKVKTLLSYNHLDQQWQKRRKKMLQDKINVSDFFAWFIENYNHSIRVMRNNPDHQLNFI